MGQSSFSRPEGTDSSPHWYSHLTDKSLEACRGHTAGQQQDQHLREAWTLCPHLYPSLRKRNRSGDGEVNSCHPRKSAEEATSGVRERMSPVAPGTQEAQSLGSRPGFRSLPRATLTWLYPRPGPINPDRSQKGESFRLSDDPQVELGCHTSGGEGPAGTWPREETLTTFILPADSPQPSHAGRRKAQRDWP